MTLVLPGHGDPIDRPRRADRRALRAARAPRGQDPRADRRAAALRRTRSPQELWGNVAVTQAYLTLSEVLGHVDLLWPSAARCASAASRSGTPCSRSGTGGQPGRRQRSGMPSRGTGEGTRQGDGGRDDDRQGYSELHADESPRGGLRGPDTHGVVRATPPQARERAGSEAVDCQHSCK